MGDLWNQTVYDIRSARLCVRRPAHDNPRGIVLFLDERTQVTEVPAPSATSSSAASPFRPRHYSSLLALGDVSADKEGEIDLAGIVRAVGVSSSLGPSTPLKTTMTASTSSTLTTPVKEGASPAKATGAPTLVVTLVDSRASLTLALPHEYSKVQLSPGDLLLVYRATVRPAPANGIGAVRVSAVRGRTKLLVNPESEDGRVSALGRWARSGQWALAGGDAKMRSLASIGEKMREKEGGESEFVAKALVANVDAAAEETVDVCVTCGERTSKDKTLCNCAAFGVRRLLQLEVELSDGTGLVRATACGSVAEALVGVETGEAVAMLRWNREEWRRGCRRLLYVARVFKIRRDESTPTGLSIVDVLPVPYAAYQLLIGKKLDKKRAQK